MRKDGYVSSATGRQRPTNVIFFDTETTLNNIDDTVKKHTLKVGIGKYTRSIKNDYFIEQDKLIFKNSEAFWVWAISKHRTKTHLYITAHNIIYDMVIVDGFKTLVNKGYELQSFYSKGGVSVFRYKNENGSLTLLDNLNLFPGKLAKYGEKFNLPKLSINFDSTSLEALIIYCERDIDIMIRLWRNWCGFLDKHNLGSFKCTLAATSFNAYRTKYLNHKIYIHNDEQALKQERLSYKGGRVEAFYQGNLNSQEYFYLDINSMYPYVMLKHQYPRSLAGGLKNPSIFYLENRLKFYSVIIDVTLNTKTNPYPFKVNKFTAYPVGSFRTTLSTPEIIYALTNDYIDKIHYIYWYKRAPLFNQYVKDFYQLKLDYHKEGNTEFRTIAKLLLNTLYGKWGQMGFEQNYMGENKNEDISVEYGYDMIRKERFIINTINGKQFITYKTGESRYSFPAIASHVTAYGRIMLFELITLAGPHNCYYCDTDSLIVNEIGYKNLEHLVNDNEIGKLALEGRSGEVRINAPKDYVFGGFVKRKGVKKDAVEVSDGVFRQEQWARFNGLVKSGNISEYTTQTIEKTLYRRIHSGVLSKSGWISPFSLPLG